MSRNHTKELSILNATFQLRLIIRLAPRWLIPVNVNMPFASATIPNWCQTVQQSRIEILDKCRNQTKATMIALVTACFLLKDVYNQRIDPWRRNTVSVLNDTSQRGKSYCKGICAQCEKKWKSSSGPVALPFLHTPLFHYTSNSVVHSSNTNQRVTIVDVGISLPAHGMPNYF